MPEIFLECYCLAREKPIKLEKTKRQAKTLISLWFCGQFTCHDLCCYWSEHNKHSWDVSSVHGFPGHTVKVVSTWSYLFISFVFCRAKRKAYHGNCLLKQNYIRRKYLPLIIDGMDQSKTNAPHANCISKVNWLLTLAK